MTSSAVLQISSALFSGDRLRIARLAAGKTVSGLAADVGVSPAAISQFENGKNKPSPDTLGKLGLALGFPLEFFGAPPPVSTETDAAFFRSRVSTRTRDRASVGAKAILLADLVGMVEAYVDLPAPSIARPEFTGRRSADEIEKLALEVRRDWNLGAGPLGSLTRLLESRGAVVVDSLAGVEKVDGFSRWLGSRAGVLLFRRNDDNARLRFSVAHELGHLVMHDVAEAGERVVEIEANQFASAFLMPSEEIFAELPARADWGYLAELKHRWGVSMQALLYRSKTLGRMTDTVYRRAITDLNRRGWREIEPSPIPNIETPSLLVRCLDLLNQHGIDGDGIIRQAALPDHLVSEFLARNQPARLRLV